MKNQRIYSEEEKAIILSNPYTLSVTDGGGVKFTFDFKIYVWGELQKGRKPKQIFEAAGYDYYMLGPRVALRYATKVRAEGNSETGLKDSTPKYARKNEFRKIQDHAAIKELQERVIYLEQEIEFLKKISILESMEKSGK